MPSLLPVPVGRRGALVCALLGLAAVNGPQPGTRARRVHHAWVRVVSRGTTSAAAISKQRWLAVLGLPGVLAGGWLLLAPSSHGAALTYDLIGSLLALIIVGIAVAREAARQR